MKQVVFLTKSNGYGGTEFHLVELIKRIDANKYRIVLICSKENRYTYLLNENKLDHVKIVEYPNRTNFFSFMHLLNKLEPNIIVFIKGNFNLFPWWMYFCRYFCKISKVFAIEHSYYRSADKFENLKKIKGIASFYKKHLGWYGRKRLKGILQNFTFDKTICVSNVIRNSLLENFHFNELKIVTVFNGVDTKKFKKKIENKPANKEGDIRRIICVTRLSKEKGVEVLLESIALLKDRFRFFKLLILGEGNLKKKLDELVIQLNISEFVEFCGFQGDIIPYLHNSDLFVLPSYIEGQSIALIEALASGLPCIVFNVGGNLEIISDGENGYVIKAEDRVALSAKIEILLKNNELRSNFFQKNIKKAKLQFNIDDNMKKIVEIIC